MTWKSEQNDFIECWQKNEVTAGLLYLIRNCSLTEHDIEVWSAGQVMFWKHLARLVAQILRRSWSISDAPFFLTKSVINYQGWGVGGSHNYDKISSPASQGIPKHKICHPSCFCREAILLQSNWMQLTKIANYILITSEAQRLSGTGFQIGFGSSEFHEANLTHDWWCLLLGHSFDGVTWHTWKPLKTLYICRETRFSLDCEIFDLKLQHPYGTNSNETQDKWRWAICQRERTHTVD